jgi:hypothetical protein
MKTMKSIPLKIAVLLAVLPFSSCMTAYDANGRPMQVVDPGAAAVGAVAIGALGYAIGQNNEPRYYGPYYGGYYGHGRHHCY